MPADHSTIQSGIDAAQAGDTVTVSAGTYSGEGNTYLDFRGKDIVLIGSGTETCIIDVGQQSSGFWFENGGETRAAVIDGFRIQYGSSYAGESGIYLRDSAPTLKNLLVVDQTQSSDIYSWCGSGIYSSRSSPYLENVHVQNCRPAGIHFKGGSPEVYDSVVMDCHSGVNCPAGGIVCNETHATFTRVAILGNTGYGGKGGGMGVVEYSDVRLEDCIFEENESYGHIGEGLGGGLYCESSTLSLSEVVFRQNSSDLGGGMACVYASASMQTVTFEQNGAGGGWGGGLYLQHSSPTMWNITFHGNDNYHSDFEEYLGHGHSLVCVDHSIPALHECIIAFDAVGVGIYSDATSSPLLYCCDIYGNAGGPFGGAMIDVIGIDGNFSADPLFCDPEGSDLRVSADSPCAPGNSECGLLIGARPVGCGTSIRMTTWSQIKAWF